MMQFRTVNPHRRTRLLGASVLLASWTSALCAGAVAAEEIRGQAAVLSGNEVVVGKKSVRLFGIDAPGLKEECRINDAKMKCGIVAWAELVKLADGQLISCDLEELPAEAAKVEDKAVYATCYIGETDVNEAMVRSGWARAVRDQTDRYEVDETDAKQSRRGIWATRRKRR